MGTVEKAQATQLANIEKRSGRTIAELKKIVQKSGLPKYGEMVAMLKQDLGLGHGDANLVVHLARNSVAGASPASAKSGKSAASSTEAELDRIYAGKKESLRPIHDKLLPHLAKLGAFEEAPKKTYISYRRKKQFAMIGPATNTRVEVGLNVKGLAARGRLEAQPPGRMCSYVVKLTDPKEVDRELVGWIEKAYEAAG